MVETVGEATAPKTTQGNSFTFERIVGNMAVVKDAIFMKTILEENQDLYFKDTLEHLIRTKGISSWERKRIEED